MNDPFQNTVMYREARVQPVPVWAFVVIGSLSIMAVNVPHIQADLFPPVSRQSVSDAKWTDTRVCWIRTSYKSYVTPIVNYDAMMDYPVLKDGVKVWRRRFPEITREDGSPVVTDRLNPVGWTRVVYCVVQTPDMDATQPVRVSLTIYFRGLWGLYNVPVSAPNVLIPPDAVLPG